MAELAFQQIVAEAKSLPAAQQLRLCNLLEKNLRVSRQTKTRAGQVNSPSRSSLRRERLFINKLVQEGVIAPSAGTKAKSKKYRPWKPIVSPGRPISEILLEDRGPR